ncbi:MAG: peptide deformylase [Paraglaciecola sp.]|jgi:peptide deformylase
MILPIFAYGQPVLKKVGEEIDKDYPELEKLLADMWQTMENAEGVGLAAPQIGRAIRLFLVDSTKALEENDAEEGIRQVFINAQILEESGKPWPYEEGCLSIPDIRGEVSRNAQIKIRYQDENFVEYTKVFDGVNARVIQHEYDHIEGVLFTEKLKPLRRKMLKRKLERIKSGKIQADYKMKFKQ